MSNWKSYHPIVFGNKEGRFRGIRSGFGPMVQRTDYVRHMLNLRADEQALQTRPGMVRRNQVEEGSITSVGVLDTVKGLSIGDKLYMVERDELYLSGSPLSQYNAGSPIPGPPPPPVLPATNLVSRWVPSLTLNANDDYGTNHGALQNSASVGSNGFDLSKSTGDYVSIAHAASLSVTSYSICAWMNLASQPTLNKFYAILAKGGITESAANNHNYCVGYDNDFWTSGKRVFDFHEASAGTNYRVDGNGALSDSTWYWVCATFDGGTRAMEIFVDNVSLGTATGANPVNTQSVDATIGMYAFDGTSTLSETFDGYLDDILLYSSVLSLADRTTIFNAGRAGATTP